jgi:hypothetical protein
MSFALPDDGAPIGVVLAGVGGQGVLLVAEALALAAVAAGYDAKQTEVHGVSQRGGSVHSHVRFGPKVHSPLVAKGEARNPACLRRRDRPVRLPARCRRAAGTQRRDSRRIARF